MFVRITLPMISPIMLLQVILQTTAALQTFNQPKILTNGGPGFSTSVLMLSIYNNGFSEPRPDPAARLRLGPGLGAVPRSSSPSSPSTAKFSSLWTYSDNTPD